MAPDLSMLVLIAVYIGLVVYDTVSTWSIERKSRRRVVPINTNGAAVAPAGTIKSFRTRTSPFMMAFELCLCGLMLGALAAWYLYATSLVQDDTFSTRWAGMTALPGGRTFNIACLIGPQLYRSELADLALASMLRC